MISLDKTYTTTCGYEVRLYEILSGRVFGVYKQEDSWFGCDWCVKDGACLLMISGEFDLVEVKKKIVHKRWVNVYEKSWVPYITREMAGRLANDERLACVEITIETEEGKCDAISQRTLQRQPCACLTGDLQC